MLTVTITVTRNEGVPIWTFNPGTVSIREDKEPFTEVITVQASDPADGVGGNKSSQIRANFDNYWLNL